MEERFNVLDGRPSFLAGKEWREAAPGEEVVVPPACGTRTATAAARGPLPLRRAAAVVAAGVPRGGRCAVAARAPAPGGLTAERLIRAAALVQRHRDMVTLLFPPLPPVWLQRLLFPPLARAGRRRGY